MSALNDLMTLAKQDGKYFIRDAAKLAEPELAALRDELAAASVRVDEWKAAHTYLDESPINDGEGDASLSLADRIAPIVNEVIALRAELAEYRTLRPAKCMPACWRKVWDAAIKAAADFVRDFDFVYEFSKRDRNLIGARDVSIASGIEALVQPADCCGECNPLDPQNDTVSVIDAALSRGYTLHVETPLDGYGREVLEAIKRDIQHAN